MHKKKKRKAMCLNGIQNILENELGAKCTNFIFLSEATIFLLRNVKNLSWHLNPFILSNNFQFWCNWKWYIHFNILMHWNSINIWSYSVYFLLIHVQHNFELKKIKECVLKYFVQKTFFSHSIWCMFEINIFYLI